MELNGDRVAIVTGAGGGIGEAVAQRLAFEGAAVVAADIDEAAADACVKGIVGHGGRAIACGADVTERGDVERMVALTAEVFGRLDVLVNNAGGVEGEAFPWSSPAVWEPTIDLNLRAPMLTIHAALELLIEAGGVVVNIASMAGLGRRAHDAPEYAAAKGGVIRLTTALGALRERGVRVNCICPDWVDTPASRRTRAAMTTTELAGVPDPMLRGDDVADAVVQLVRDDAVAGGVMVLPCGAPARLLAADR